MQTQTYHMPKPSGPVADLVPESADGYALTPDTTVLCIHRGRHVLVDKFDGRDYRIAPGEFYAPYGAALHFQARAVIPGTRNPELGVQQSYIGILGIDDPERCAPLTDAEVAKFDAQVEAIDREALSDPAARAVTVVPTAVARRAVRGQAAGKRPQIRTSGQASEAAEEAAAHAFERAGFNPAAGDE